MRNFYLTFTSDKIDKMRIFGALLDAGMENFVITESIEVGDISAAEEMHTCLNCEYGKKAVYCQYDDQYCDEADINEECVCWEASTVAENAQVDHFRETTKKIELMEE